MLQKKKICKKCGNETLIFSKGLCKFCWLILNPPDLKSSSIKKVSREMESKLEKYNRLKKEHFLEHPNCARCGTTEDVDLHHANGRKGQNLFKYFITLCRRCHRWVHDNPKNAKEQGFLM